MADIKFSTRAYCKMLLHCAKYPHCAVNGVLLANANTSKEPKNGNSITFVDSVPLFHICLHLTPMYEVALTQIDQMAGDQGLVIAGYYLANENYRDTSSETGHRIAEKIAESFPSACLVVVDNRKLSMSLEDSALIISQHFDGKWKTKEKSSISVEENTLDTTAALLSQKEQLIDFDNHLDDITLDWKNSSLNKLIEYE